MFRCRFAGFGKITPQAHSFRAEDIDGLAVEYDRYPDVDVDMLQQPLWNMGLLLRRALADDANVPADDMHKFTFMAFTIASPHLPKGEDVALVASVEQASSFLVLLRTLYIWASAAGSRAAESSGNSWQVR